MEFKLQFSFYSNKTLLDQRNNEEVEEDSHLKKSWDDEDEII